MFSILQLVKMQCDNSPQAPATKMPRQQQNLRIYSVVNEQLSSYDTIVTVSSKHKERKLRQDLYI